MASATGDKTEFPILCDTCLGDNPYVRMIRANMDAECKICTRPFTVYTWKAGTEGRFKRTEICPTCAKVKSCCQTCLFDLITGLPLQARDALLKKQGITSNAGELIRPKSDTMLIYQSSQNEKLVDSGSLMSPVAIGMLQGLAKSTPDYRRNRAKICSFWLKGTCNRGEMCPFRHEQPDHKDAALSDQNMKDRYYGTNDPLAQKILDRVDPKYKIADESVTSIWVGGILSSKGITEEDLRSQFQPFGQIVSIRMRTQQQCAFIEYGTHSEASQALESLRNNLVIKGQFCKVAWAKPSSKNGPERGVASKDPSTITAVNPPPIAFAPYYAASTSSGSSNLSNPGWGAFYPSMNPSYMGAVEKNKPKENSDSEIPSGPRVKRGHADSNTNLNNNQDNEAHDNNSQEDQEKPEQTGTKKSKKN